MTTARRTLVPVMRRSDRLDLDGWHRRHDVAEASPVVASRRYLDVPGVRPRIGDYAQLAFGEERAL
jgi:hypothetical protein